MATESILDTYLRSIDALLVASAPVQRAGEAARPPSPFADVQLRQAQQVLQDSQALQDDLWQRWREAMDAYERSKIEVQLLAAAAADLAIAERLLRGDADDAMRAAMRSATTGGSEALIRQALSAPEKLLAPAKVPKYRSGQESQQLQAAVYNCLEAVRKSAVAASRSSLTSLLAMDLAILKEAAEALGADISRSLREAAQGAVKLALEYVLAALQKLHLLLGLETEAEIRKAVLEFIDKLKDGEYVDQVVAKFLNTTVIYEEGKAWIAGYQGDKTLFAGTATAVAALQGSFEGRVKIADVVIKGLAVARLLPPLAVPPWGPLGIAAAYLGVVGYVLYSAHDHVDSDRFTFLDRVHGVRGILIADLGVQPAPAD